MEEILFWHLYVDENRQNKLLNYTIDEHKKLSMSHTYVGRL